MFFKRLHIPSAGILVYGVIVRMTFSDDSVVYAADILPVGIVPNGQC